MDLIKSWLDHQCKSSSMRASPAERSVPKKGHEQRSISNVPSLIPVPTESEMLFLSFRNHHALLGPSNLCHQRDHFRLDQWPCNRNREKLEVPIYHLFFRPINFRPIFQGISPQFIWPKIRYSTLYGTNVPPCIGSWRSPIDWMTGKKWCRLPPCAPLPSPSCKELGGHAAMEADMNTW